jgi:homoserine kinase
LPAAQELAGTPGILGAALSGAGPSVLLFLDPKPRVPEKRIAAKVAAHFKAKGLPAELLVTSIAQKGARG